MTLENFNSNHNPEQRSQDIEVIHIETLGDPINECNVISAIFSDQNVYYAGINSPCPDGWHSHIEHTRLQQKAGIGEKDIIGGLVIKRGDTNLRISHGSGTYENTLPKDQIDRYVDALMGKLKTIYPESDIASSRGSSFI